MIHTFIVVGAKICFDERGVRVTWSAQFIFIFATSGWLRIRTSYHGHFIFIAVEIRFTFLLANSVVDIYERCGLWCLCGRAWHGIRSLRLKHATTIATRNRNYRFKYLINVFDRIRIHRTAAAYTQYYQAAVVGQWDAQYTSNCVHLSSLIVFVYLYLHLHTYIWHVSCSMLFDCSYLCTVCVARAVWQVWRRRHWPSVATLKISSPIKSNLIWKMWTSRLVHSQQFISVLLPCHFPSLYSTNALFDFVSSLVSSSLSAMELESKCAVRRKW